MIAGVDGKFFVADNYVPSRVEAEVFQLLDFTNTDWITVGAGNSKLTNVVNFILFSDTIKDNAPLEALFKRMRKRIQKSPYAKVLSLTFTENFKHALATRLVMQGYGSISDSWLLKHSLSAHLVDVLLVRFSALSMNDSAISYAVANPLYTEERFFKHMQVALANEKPHPVFNSFNDMPYYAQLTFNSFPEHMVSERVLNLLADNGWAAGFEAENFQKVLRAKLDPNEEMPEDWFRQFSVSVYRVKEDKVEEDAL